MSIVADSHEARTRPVVSRGLAHSCFFRSAASGDGRKALVQITERCNLHCAHCFVSSTRHGADMTLETIAGSVLPRLKRARVERLTLTGGEPFVHPEIVGICEAATAEGFAVGVCTNASCISDDQIASLREMGSVHINVSFDGFRPESHGRFRGDIASFEVSVEATRRLAAAGLLHGILSTPNALTAAGDFAALTAFAREEGAEYLLMNPLSAFGRGAKSRRRFAAGGETMLEILAAVEAGRPKSSRSSRFASRTNRGRSLAVSPATSSTSSSMVPSQSVLTSSSQRERRHRVTWIASSSSATSWTAKLQSLLIDTASTNGSRLERMRPVARAY